jgi:hypothetical protein
MHKITAGGKDGGKRDILFDYYPDYCPVCHTAADIKMVSTEGHLFSQAESNFHRYLIISNVLD